jgi:hypothetical protein
MLKIDCAAYLTGCSPPGEQLFFLPVSALLMKVSEK